MNGLCWLTLRPTDHQQRGHSDCKRRRLLLNPPQDEHFCELGTVQSVSGASLTVCFAKQQQHCYCCCYLGWTLLLCFVVDED